MGDDFSLALVKSLLTTQQEVNLPDKPMSDPANPDAKEHYDIFLARNLYPVLVPALEDLSREISRFTEQTGKLFTNL